MRQHLVRTDLSRGVPCPQGDCLTNPGEGGGLRHHRSGALYTGVCQVCPQERGEWFTVVYTGESGDSGYVRTKMHVSSIQRRDRGNAFSKHLEEYHPERDGDFKCFKFEIARTFRKSLLRQIWEAVEIHGCRAQIILNSKAEWEQPVVERVVVTREPPGQPPVQQRGGGGAGRGRGGGEGGVGGGGGRRGRSVGVGA